MIERPEVKYARATDGVHIAYQAFGVGLHDLLFVPGNITHLDLQWEDPESSRWLRHLGQQGRLIVLDRRGVGLSDRMSPDDLPSAEVLVEDLGAVLRHAGASNPVLVGFAEGGQWSALYAAAHPDMVRALILYATWTHIPRSERPGWEHYLSWAPERWGSPEVAMMDAREVSPSRATDPRYVDWVARVQRGALSPGAVRPLYQVSVDLDVRSVLPTIQVPTLVMHRKHDSSWPDEALLSSAADLIPGARHVTLPGEDHWITGEPQEAMFDAIATFLDDLVGRQHASTRRLATVVFTDIVSSTERASELGDAAWAEALEAHHQLVREALARHGGREISTAGDGFYATFDGPAAATRSASEIAAAVRTLGLEIRAGVHTGEVEMIDDEIGGIGVTIGARVAALAGPSEVLVSSTVKDLTAGSGLVFEDAGEHELKGVPDRWRLYRVVA